MIKKLFTSILPVLIVFVIYWNSPADNPLYITKSKFEKVSISAAGVWCYENKLDNLYKLFIPLQYIYKIERQ